MIFFTYLIWRSLDVVFNPIGLVGNLVGELDHYGAFRDDVKPPGTYCLDDKPPG